MRQCEELTTDEAAHLLDKARQTQSRRPNNLEAENRVLAAQVKLLQCTLRDVRAENEALRQRARRR